MLAILILLLSSTLQVPSARGTSHATTQAAENGLNATTEFPYVINASALPYPSNVSLGNLSASSPKLAVTDLGYAPIFQGGGSLPGAGANSLEANAFVGNASNDNVPFYELAYLAKLPNGLTELMYQTGEVDPNASYQILANPACGSACPHLPINWSAPIPLLSLESAVPEGNAIAASGARVAVAVASSGDTRIYWSGDYGFPGSWVPLTADGLVAGTGPELALSGCDVFVTTITPTSTLATTLPLSCPLVPQSPAGTSSSVPYAGGTLPSAGGMGPSLPPPSGGATVTGVSPSSGPAGTVVYVSGSGFQPGAEVYFGGIPVPVTSSTSSTLLTAIAPAGPSGVVDVQVYQGGSLSPPNPPSDDFMEVTSASSVPTVQSVAPDSGSSGTTITVTGSGFVSGVTTVLFDGTPVTPTTVSSSTSLTVSAPSGGSGAQDIQVEVSGINSPVNWPRDVFTYLGTPSPSVIGVLPNTGIALTPVTVVGTEFSYPITVAFGGNPASNVMLLSTTELTALAPLGPLGQAVDVQVTEGASTSPINSPEDQFSYPLITWPAVSEVIPASGPVGTEVTVYGSDFESGAVVDFGAYPSSSVTVDSSQMLTVIAPDAVGAVDVTVADGGHTSNTSTADRFNYTGTPSTTNLPASVSNAPIVLSSGGAEPEEAVLASVGSNDSVQWWSSSNEFTSHSTRYLATYNSSMGSPIFGKIGGTDLVVPGSSGQVTVSGEGTYLFAAFTTRAQDVSGIDTMVSTDAGLHWKVGTQLFAPRGSLADPVAAPSPGGYTYLAAIDNGEGAWQPDEAVVSDTGRLLSPIAALPGALGTNATTAGGIGVAVDSYMRPLYVWSESNLSKGSVLDYTGGYLSAGQAVAYAQAALSKTLPTDYRDFWSHSVYNFRPYVAANLTQVETDLQAYSQDPNWQDLEYAQVEALDYLYPLMSVSPSPLVSIGPPAPDCYGGGLGVWTNVSQFANATGPYVAGTYMAVYLAWILQALGCETIDPPLWLGTPEHGGALIDPTGESGAVPLGTPGTASASWGSITVTPLAVNPNEIELNATPDIPGWSDYSGASSCQGGFIGWYASRYVVTTNLSNSTTTYSFWSNSSIPAVFLTHADPQATGSWWESIAVYVTDYAVNYYCDGTYENTTGTPDYVGTLSVHGSYSTYLGFDPTQPTAILAPVPGSSTEYNLVTNWTNTMLANVSVIALNGPNSLHEQQSTTNLSYAERFEFGDLGFGSYSWSAEIESAAGNDTPAGPFLNLEATNTLSGPLTHDYGLCDFTVSTDPIGIYWYSGQNVTNLSATQATLTWYSNEAGMGWATYSDANGASFTVRASIHEMSNHTAWEYVAELTGLDPWGEYNATVGVTVNPPGGSCVGYENTASWSFLTAGVAPVTESDYPYDSVTKVGGGALVEWTIPLAFTQRTTFVNGNVSYWPVNNTSTLVQVPIAALAPIGVVGLGSGFGVTYAVNLTALEPDWNYSVDLFLNFTFHGVRTPAYGNVTFWYARDTSGDGLTDWEKVQGWNVTYQDASGNWNTEHVQAVPAWYATNGLVGDYVEKEFGLSPSTIDTAGSDLLDTWNLTFDLGHGASVACPSEFKCWYANASNPFSYAATPGGSPPAHDQPRSNESTGAMHFGKGGLEDDSPNASAILWKGKSLSVLESLMQWDNVPWLRGVIMKYPNTGNWTMTVWGKLSWGANPLAASTPLNGVTDGSRLNPVTAEDLEITDLSASVNSCPNPGSATWGWAVQSALNETKPSGLHELTNYSTAAYDTTGSGCGSLSSYQVPIPVSATTQFQDLQVRVLINEGTTGSPHLVPLAINGSATQPGTARFDMFAGSPTTYSYTSASGASVSFTLETVAAGAKEPTYLWLPTDNGTLNGLPWGLTRYTGEQAFDLLDIENPTNAPISSTVDYAQNASDQYPVSLSEGVTNLLVPRTQFMESAIGQAVLLGKVAPYTNSTADPPLLDEAWSAISGFSSSHMTALACYWQNRAIATTTGAISSCSSMTGTSITSSENVEVVAETSANGVNTASLPAVPGAESASDEGAALQAMVTLNVSSATELELLLAGLMDNVTGGYNGTLVSVTNQVAQLGLNPVVADALANETLTSSGLFGIPESTAPPPPTNGVLGQLENSVSGMVEAEGVFLSVAWSQAQAFATFIDDHIPPWMKALGEDAISRVASALVSVGDTLSSYMATLDLFFYDAVVALLSPIVDPVTGAAQSFDRSLAAAANSTVEDIETLGSVTQADALSVAHALDPAAVDGVAIATAIGIALALLTPMSFGSGFLIGIVIVLIGSFAQEILTGYARITTLTSSAVFALEDSVDNSVPRTDWEAIAGFVAIAASTSDFFFNVALALAKEIPDGAPMLALALALVIDLCVLPASIIAWAGHLPVVAAIALVFAVLGIVAAVSAAKNPAYSRAVGNYVYVSLGLATIGLGAATADLALS